MTTSRFSSFARRLLALAALAPISLTGCVVVSGGGGDACSFGEETYDVGESFPAGDGCNTCECMEDGSVGCTLMACNTGTCEYEGGSYDAGESFQAADGCNTCTCNDDGSVGCTEMACGCFWEGEPHQAGESFPAGDGCNTCSCTETGDVACTLMACPVCTYEGQTYWPGESFPAGDGCNTCTCGDDGLVGCTKINCTCDPESEWWRSYVSTDAAQCEVLDFMCPENTTQFANVCGCGCEQSAECPEFFDCMPPAACDVDAIHAECPYSDIAF